MLIVVSIIILLIAATNIALYYSGILEIIKSSSYKSFFLLGLYLLQTVILILPLIILTKMRYKLRPRDFGFHKMSLRKSLLSAIEGYLLYIGITLVITIIVLNFDLRIPGYQLPERILPLFGNDIPSIVIAGIIVVAVAPVVEEIFFRGFLLRTLSNKIGLWAGSAITASVFALFHMQFASIIPIFILSLIINSLVIRNKSIYPAIYFHILNNAIAFVIEILLVFEVIKIESII